MIKAWLDDDGYHVIDADRGEEMVFETINEALGVITERIEPDSVSEPVSVPVVIWEPTATRDERVWAWHPRFKPDTFRRELPTEMGDS